MKVIRRVTVWIACWSEMWFAVFLYPRVPRGEYVVVAVAVAAAAALAYVYGCRARLESLA